MCRRATHSGALEVERSTIAPPQRGGFGNAATALNVANVGNPNLLLLRMKLMSWLFRIKQSNSIISVSVR